MFGCEAWFLPTSMNAPPGFGQVTHRRATYPESGGADTSPSGEEEAEAAEFAAPVSAGVWCKREMLRTRGGAIRERSSAWTSSSRAARPRYPSGSASTWPRS
ncbi:hypothetical protein CP967_21230 [Streptomyces nitrosporeus]|uniref:Uncharacterized protein n=1 Tax=Streptomyces nitrosporeus TaxID=28894 RepID=A0A5J6FH16_9ACTN|nr:hypothetical protein CP967_21230 [Streptomyces nitrosporeus]